ncbi:MAG TPA: serine hydrolase domain-containing protein [Bacillota bacterium]|nr:serine hydrolase domain-containing protein [Bacillota bacterium]
MDQQMQSLVTNLVQKNPTIRSCVLSVSKGDDSYAWTGAAGVSNEAGYREMAKDTPIYIASITKLFTAVVVMRLQEKGLLSLNDPMAKYLPEKLIHGIHVYKGKDYTRVITIQQLLSHTSGIADYYTEKPRGGKSLFEVFLEEPERRWTVDETIEKARKELKPHFRPGTDAFYSDTNYQLLGKIIEAVTGKPLQDAYDEIIFRPLGLTHTCLAVYSEPLGAAEPAEVFEADRNITKIRSNGSYWADGGIVSTADDLVTFLKALNEGRIVSNDTVREMHHWHKIEFPFQYGYGTMYFTIPWPMNNMMGVPPLWGHSGSTGSFLYYAEDQDLYFAGTINQTKANLKPFQLMGSVIKVISTKRE